MNNKFLSLAVAATLVVSAVGVGSASASETENGADQFRGKTPKMNQEKFIEAWDQLSDEEKEARLFEKAQKVGIETDGKTFEEIQEELRAYASENGAKGNRGHGPKGKGMNLEKLAEKWDELTEEQQNQFFERAAGLGIETDGKSFEEVMASLQELHEARVIERAEEAGIETEGKSIEEIQEELRALAPEHGKRGQGSKGKRFDQEKFIESWNQLSDEEKEVKLFEHAEKLGIDTEGKTFEEIQVELHEQREARLFEKAQELGIETDGKTMDEIKEEMKEMAPKKGEKHEVTL
ncbi:hypothetical protein [Chengkuizengella sediminis]|uniref:hypothetical protein n=1 Tax=Chengkuizengella sediminis TaxID=1885917 RepID=UPI00138A3096|nr:hypothetical protein [Chengkuizengella sediminis]NDI34819.1 hypothetical protein [Chengkuizengella sediminis]